MNKPLNIFAPEPRSLTLRSGKAGEKNPEPILFTTDFFVCFVSFSMLLISGMWGTMAIVGFLAPWPLIVFRHYDAAKRALAKNWPLFLIPSLALLSTVWSDDPHKTMRAGAEFAVTVAIGILAGECIKPKILMISVLAAFMLGAVLSLLIGRTEVISMTGQVAYSGIFGSKNAFAAVMSLLMLISLTVCTDTGQKTIFRSIGLAGILSAPLMLYHGRSLDSVVGLFLAFFIFLSVRALKRFRPIMRLVIFTCILVPLVFIMLVLSVSEINPLNALTLVGKDATLTGRTFLWNRASDFVSERPVLGVGYQSFWRLDNPRAQELWYKMHVPPGSGLGFHNEYVSMTVELGIAGLAIMLGTFFAFGRRIKKVVFGSMDAEQNFAFLLFAFFMIRTPVEVSLFTPFNISIILFCVIWVYFQPPDSPIRPYGLRRGKGNIFAPGKTKISVT